ncbi:hypothetical protein [Demequina litorisediminis]|nr:hypothetical protein [Demequina litorisediminis]
MTETITIAMAASPVRIAWARAAWVSLDASDVTVSHIASRSGS